MRSAVSLGLFVIVIPDETSDKARMVKLVNDPRLSNVRAPWSVSRSGAIRLVIPEPASTVRDPLIFSMLYNAIFPLTEDAIVMLPLRVSQLARLSASF